MDNRGTLKALVGLAGKAQTGPWKVNTDAYNKPYMIASATHYICIATPDDPRDKDTKNTFAFIAAARNSIPALEALLQEPSVPVSELEALASKWQSDINPLTNTHNNPWYDERISRIKDLRSLINRSHK